MVKLPKGWHLFLLIFLLGANIGSIGFAQPTQATSLPSTLQFIPIVSGLTKPVLVTNAGDGSNRLFIIQQTGQIRIFKNGSLLSTPFLNILGLVSNFTGLNGEQGLLSLAFDPNYLNNGYFYVTYTTNNNNPTFIYTTTLARYHVSSESPDLANPMSGTILLSIPKKYANHNGSMLAFGLDGYLYMSMGDGGSGGDPDNNAQNPHTMLGKILRLDVNSTPPIGQKYVIPISNPFFGSSDPGVNQEIWAYGLRNPWRFSFDRSTGDLYIGDVGQDTEEEVDFQPSTNAGGQNYGWNVLEGNLCYNPSTNCIAPSHNIPPIATYDHGGNDSYGCSITGGYVYRGNSSHSLQGVYFYGDFCSGKVFGLIKNPDNTWTSSLISSTNYFISSFGQDEQGELYLTDYSAGIVYQISSATHTVSGNVSIGGAVLSYLDGIPKTVTTFPDSSYSLTVPYNWSGTVVPSLACYTFNPLNRSYSNVVNDQVAQDYTFTIDPGPGCAHITITIGGLNEGSYGIPLQGSRRASLPSVNNGPVKVNSDVPIVASERVIYNVNGVNTSFSEMMGLPDSQLSTTYWLPWYNNVDLDTQLRFGNVSGSTATVHVFIGGAEMTGSPYTTLLTGQSTRVSFAGVNDGPVKVLSDVNIVAAERVIYKVNGTNTSFSEMMALPDSLLNTTYWLPWYNNVDLDTQLRFGNVSGSTATVHVFIGGSEMTGSPFTLLTGQSTRISFAGVNNGPVKVLSDVNIVAAERVIYKVNGTNTSFSEMMALPNSLLTTTYWMPWYNNVDLDTQLRFGNVSGSTATVHVFIGGAEMTGSPFTLLTGQSTRVSFAGVNNGPVKVLSDVNIVAAERVIYKVNGVNTSFSEMMALPDSLLNTTYWLPWYNNVDLDTQLRFGMP